MYNKTVPILILILFVASVSAQDIDDTGKPVNPVVKNIEDIQKDINNLNTEFVNVQQTINNLSGKMDEQFKENFSRIVIALFALMLVTESFRYLWTSWRKHQLWGRIKDERKKKQGDFMKAYEQQKDAINSLEAAVTNMVGQLGLAKKSMDNMTEEMDKLRVEAVQVRKLRDELRKEKGLPPIKVGEAPTSKKKVKKSGGFWGFLRRTPKTQEKPIVVKSGPVKQKKPGLLQRLFSRKKKIGPKTPEIKAEAIETSTKTPFIVNEGYPNQPQNQEVMPIETAMQEPHTIEPEEALGMPEKPQKSQEDRLAEEMTKDMMEFGMPSKDGSSLYVEKDGLVSIFGGDPPKTRSPMEKIPEEKQKTPKKPVLVGEMPFSEAKHIAKSNAFFKIKKMMVERGYPNYDKSRKVFTR